MKRAFHMFKLVFSKPQRAIDTIYYNASALFGNNDFVPFVVLSRARSGSNLLRSHLNSHGQVRVDAESLNWLRGRKVSGVVSRTFSRQPKWIKAKGFKVF